MVLVPLVTILIASKVYDYTHDESRSEKQIKAQLVQKTIQNARAIEAVLQKASAPASALAKTLSVLGQIDEEKLYEILEHNTRDNPIIYGSAVAYIPNFYQERERFSPYVYRSGENLVSMDIGVDGYDYTASKWQWFQRPIQDKKSIWTEPYFDEGAGNILMTTFSAPIMQNGAAIGVTTVDVDLSNLLKIANIQESTDEHWMILDPIGTLIYDSDPSNIGKTVYSTKYFGQTNKEEIASLLIDREPKVKDILDREGENQWIGMGTINPTGWHLFLAASGEKSLNELHQQMYYTVFIVSSLLLVITLIGWFQVNRVINPIIMLANAAKEITDGNLHTNKIPTQTSDEIGTLIQSFSMMRDKIISRENDLKLANEKLEDRVQERTEKLAESDKNLQIALDNMPGALIITGPDLRIKVLSTNFNEYVNLPPDHLKAGDSHEKVLRFMAENGYYGNDIDVEAIIHERIESLLNPDGQLLFDHLPDGRINAVSRKKSPSGDVITVVVDVTLQKKQEAELQEKELQLSAAMENMSSGILMIDSNLKLRVFNQKYTHMFHLPDLKAGMSVRDIFNIRAVRGEFGEDAPDSVIEQKIQAILSRSQTKTEETTLDKRIIEGFYQPTADGGVVAIFNDITVRKKAEEELARQNRKIQNLSQQLSRYLSPQIYEAIFSGAADTTVRTERKKLTVFFSDIKNFTATTEEMEPEDMTYLLNDYLTKMTEIALEHGGTIDKYVGDAILIFFGDPDTKGVKEDALSAVRMAVAMQRRMVDLRAKWADMGFKMPFHIRCGINTGFCNVGNFGSEQRIDYTIIGGQVNLAARLESICEPDGITIAYETYTHIRDEFDADKMPPIEVKGIREPVQPYALKDIFQGWDAHERYIRKDIRGMRLWVDLMRMTEEQRLQSQKELKEALQIIETYSIDEDKD